MISEPRLLGPLVVSALFFGLPLVAADSGGGSGAAWVNPTVQDDLPCGVGILRSGHLDRPQSSHLYRVNLSAVQLFQVNVAGPLDGTLPLPVADEATTHASSIKVRILNAACNVIVGPAASITTAIDTDATYYGSVSATTFPGDYVLNTSTV